MPILEMNYVIMHFQNLLQHAISEFIIQNKPKKKSTPKDSSIGRQALRVWGRKQRPMMCL